MNAMTVLNNSDPPTYGVQNIWEIFAHPCHNCSNIQDIKVVKIKKQEKIKFFFIYFHVILLWTCVTTILFLEISLKIRQIALANSIKTQQNGPTSKDDWLSSLLPDFSYTCLHCILFCDNISPGMPYSSCDTHSTIDYHFKHMILTTSFLQITLSFF